MTAAADRLPLALTMGEPAGIGGEIALKAWANHRANLPAFFLIDDPARLERIAGDCGLDVALCPIGGPAEAVDAFPKALPVLPQPIPKPTAPGKPAAENVPAVLDAIRRAVECVRTGLAAALVTNPIHKHSLQAAGVTYPGHTEYLAHLAGGGAQSVMLLAIDTLRVVPVTVHEPLRTVANHLTRERIVLCGRITAEGLQRDFGIAHPRLAVAALNPHAGEAGALGHEEETIIAPAIADLAELGIAATGPHPADTLFHASARDAYDAVLCMYHDQALIPLKTIDFAGGVNVTLGLPFVRTSPDHGTAFGIAGQGIADETSLVAALRLADAIAARRQATPR
ncbi:MAG: 4-hydroxythreonine-4-phosphate dehydrogenase PdxA [Alphaproteobacteria bacterium]|nr:4-hydroxythreonine-4-phosphate dehydrogenase PdxA [Alphaproteobacteria bacterium]